jgi:hypothetical protein
MKKVKWEMIDMDDQYNVFGARISSVDNTSCIAWLNWLSSPSNKPQGTHGVVYALAHCDAGVTWGYLGKNGKWSLGSHFDPVLCPVPTVQSIQEIRFFGPCAELLIWRTENGLKGRLLIDESIGEKQNDPLFPMLESRYLRGSAVKTHEFVHYIDDGGLEQMAPASLNGKLYVKHYFIEENETGAVKIFISRLLSERCEL